MGLLAAVGLVRAHLVHGEAAGETLDKRRELGRVARAFALARRDDGVCDNVGRHSDEQVRLEPLALGGVAVAAVAVVAADVRAEAGRVHGEVMLDGPERLRAALDEQAEDGRRLGPVEELRRGVEVRCVVKLAALLGHAEQRGGAAAGQLGIDLLDRHEHLLPDRHGLVAALTRPILDGQGVHEVREQRVEQPDLGGLGGVVGRPCLPVGHGGHPLLGVACPAVEPGGVDVDALVGRLGMERALTRPHPAIGHDVGTAGVGLALDAVEAGAGWADGAVREDEQGAGVSLLRRVGHVGA